jgi:hypothetical protein
MPYKTFFNFSASFLETFPFCTEIPKAWAKNFTSPLTPSILSTEVAPPLSNVRVPSEFSIAPISSVRNEYK